MRLCDEKLAKLRLESGVTQLAAPAADKCV